MVPPQNTYGYTHTVNIPQQLLISSDRDMHIYTCVFKYFSMCQTRSNNSWIMNPICTFMYLFVVYFSFAPVISASIHRYVNYFYIQVLMMVTETETLTSTLNHDIFTYLDYVFFCYLHTHTYIHTNGQLTTIYIYIYIYTRTYTHTHIFMYPYLLMCLYICTYI